MKLTPRTIGYTGDFQPVRVEHNLFGAGLCEHIEFSGAAYSFSIEIERQIERNVGNSRYLGLCIRRAVDGIRTGQNR